MRSGAAVVALGLSLTIGGCAGGPSQDQLAQARQEGAAAASQAAEAEKAKAEQKKLAADVAAAVKAAADAAAAAKAAAAKNTAPGGGTSGGVASGGGGRSCGGTISVSSATSCSFAENVVADWRGAGGGSASFWSHSPVTGRSYWMRCTAGVPTVCRGGNNAVVYIR